MSHFNYLLKWATNRIIDGEANSRATCVCLTLLCVCRYTEYSHSANVCYCCCYVVWLKTNVSCICTRSPWTQFRIARDRNNLLSIRYYRLAFWAIHRHRFSHCLVGTRFHIQTLFSHMNCFESSSSITFHLINLRRYILMPFIFGMYTIYLSFTIKDRERFNYEQNGCVCWWLAWIWNHLFWSIKVSWIIEQTGIYFIPGIFPYNTHANTLNNLSNRRHSHINAISETISSETTIRLSPNNILHQIHFTKCIFDHQFGTYLHHFHSIMKLYGRKGTGALSHPYQHLFISPSQRSRFDLLEQNLL